MIPHPEGQRLHRALLRCLPLAGPWAGDLYRFAVPRWATVAHLLTGAGALQEGGRWHPMGLCRAVYGSLDPETALAESLAHFRRFHWPIRNAMPRTLNAVAAQLHHVLDLTHGPIRQRLGLSFKRILEERWWERQERDEEALTQAVGRAAFQLGLEALVVPSAVRARGAGLVLFPDNQRPQSTLVIVNPGDLPRELP
jgi:RES domain-containing protein